MKKSQFFLLGFSGIFAKQEIFYNNQRIIFPDFFNLGFLRSIFGHNRRNIGFLDILILFNYC